MEYRGLEKLTHKIGPYRFHFYCSVHDFYYHVVLSKMLKYLNFGELIN